jgi:hypothetical protein
LPAWVEQRGIIGFEPSVIAATRPIMAILGPIGFGIVADLGTLL